MSAANPSQRRLIARLGGLTRSSLYDGRDVTQAARAAFMDRFEREVDPLEKLPIAERKRRAQAAKKAYFTRLALRRSVAQRSAKAAP